MKTLRGSKLNKNCYFQSWRKRNQDSFESYFIPGELFLQDIFSCMSLFEPVSVSVETYFFFLFLMKPKKPSGYSSGANTIWGQLLCIRGRLQTFDFTGNVGSGYVKEATEFTSKGNRYWSLTQNQESYNFIIIFNFSILNLEFKTQINLKF